MFGKFKSWLGGADDYQTEPVEAVYLNPADPPLDSLSDYLNYGSYDEINELFTLKNSDNKPLGVGFVMELNPFLGADDDLVGKLTNLFTILPEHTPIQIQMFGSPDLRHFLGRYREIQRSRHEGDPARPVFEQLSKRRVDFWKKGTRQILFENTAIRLRELRCIISVNLNDVDPSNASSLRQATSLMGRIKDSLRALQLYQKTWNADDLLAWTAMMLNPQRMLADQENELDPQWDEQRFLNEQIVETRTAIKVMDSGSGIRFSSGSDTVVAQCYSVNRYPEDFHLAGMGALIGDAIEHNMNYISPFLISMAMFRPDYDATRNTVQIKAARAKQTAESKMAAIMPEAIRQKKDYDICLDAFSRSSGGGGTVKLLHQLVLWDKPENINLAESQAVAVWQSQGFGLYRDQYLQIGSLLTALPMSLDKEVNKYLTEKKRWTTKTMTNAVCMSPLIGEWEGLGEPVIGLFGTRGQAMGIDLFANPAGNYNFAVIGASGSGKSFFANEIVRNYLALGAQIWIIDVGRSYYDFCKMIGGQYIEFGYEQKLCFPPFQMITEIEEDIELLKLIFGLMASPSDSLTEHQEAKLERIIQEVWFEYGRNGTVDHIRERCLNSLVTGTDGQGVPGERDFSMVAIGDQLYAYSSEGMYGQYFNGTLNVEFTNDLVVLELEELKTKPDLQQIIMQLIMYRIMQGMYLSRSTFKIMMIDEAWALLGDTGSSARFIEEGYRRVRKYKGACGTLTQGADDYYKTKAAEAALANADFVFHLRAGAKSLATIQDRQPFEINDHVMRLLRSLSKTNYYSEVFVSTPIGYGVGRLYSDPFNALVSSSKAEDFEAVSYYRQQGLDTAQAVEKVLMDRGIGLS